MFFLLPLFSGNGAGVHFKCDLQATACDPLSKMILILNIVDTEVAAAMYVCICNAITDHQVRSLSNGSRKTVADVHRALGVRIQCGKCVRTIKDLVEQPVAAAIAAISIPAFAMTDCSRCLADA
jgi:bacterioferritin-associated ferredoxin